MVKKIRINKIFGLACVLALAFAATSCKDKPTNTSTLGIAKVMCDASFQNILDQEIEVFEYTYPDANILPRYVGEYDAVDSLLQKKVDVVITTKDLTDAQKDVLKKQGRAYRSSKIAVDAVAIIVNNKNDIDELSLDDLKDMFTGKSQKWGDVFPTKLKNDSIKIVFDRSGSSINHYMKDKFLGGKPFGKNVFAVNSAEELFKVVENQKNAIGFVGVSWIADDMSKPNKSIDARVNDLKNNNEASAIDFTKRIKVLSIRSNDEPQGYKPYQYYINEGSYPLFRVIYAIDAAPGGTLDHGFYSFLTGVIGQKIILQTGIVPAAEPVRNVELK
ncbi:MAG: substrate-binding domain-containing protein [Sodaliphilus sp.]|nr:substrate-binding domain-containing protein [Sodaliphilus sp.]